MRRGLKHLAPGKKPVSRSMSSVGEVSLESGRGGQPSFFVRSRSIRAHLPGEAPERYTGVAEIPKQQSGDTVHLVVCEGVQRIDQNCAHAWLLQFSLTQEIVDHWEEKRLGLARAGTRCDKVVFVATNGCRLVQVKPPMPEGSALFAFGEFRPSTVQCPIAHQFFNTTALLEVWQTLDEWAAHQCSACACVCHGA